MNTRTGPGPSRPVTLIAPEKRIRIFESLLNDLSRFKKKVFEFCEPAMDVPKDSQANQHLRHLFASLLVITDQF